MTYHAKYRIKEDKGRYYIEEWDGEWQRKYNWWNVCFTHDEAQRKIDDRVKMAT